MAISFDKALGIHEDALLIRERRAQVIAGNLANADTPGYKARDLDFQSLIRDAMDAKQAGSMETSARRHYSSALAASVDGALLYRNPMQPSLDGNTVDTDIEMAQFAKNTMDFQASLTFLKSKFKGLNSALKGE